MSSIELELNIFFKKLANSNDNENKNKRLCYLYYDLPTIEKILKGVNSNKKKKHELWFKGLDQFEDFFERNDKGWKSKFFNWIAKVNSYNINIMDFSEIIRDQKFLSVINEILDKYDYNKLKNKYYILCSSYEADNSTCWGTFGNNSSKNLDKVEIEISNGTKVKIVDNKFIFKHKIKEINIKSSAACLCIDKDGLECALKDSIVLTAFVHAGYIHYDEASVFDYFNEFLSIIYVKYKNNLKSKKLIEEVNNCIDRINLFFKDKFYKYEKEYRFIVDKRIFKKNKYFSKKRGKNIYTFSFDLNLIDHITLNDRKDYARFAFFGADKIKLSLKCINKDSKIFYEEENGIRFSYED